MIVGFSKIEDINGKLVSLEDTSDLESGNLIKKVNGQEIKTIEELKSEIDASQGNILNILVSDSKRK